MIQIFSRHRFIVLVMLFILACGIVAKAQDPENLSEEQKREFLLKAAVVHDTQVGKGITGIHRLTLSDGKIQHDAAFQSIDEYKPVMKFPDGRSENNFRDSYKYDIAAFELAKLLGLGEMMPVTVARKWEGKIGALSWWLPVKMDERRRVEKKIEPPDIEAWNKQMLRMRVFTQLVFDTDRNLGNVLISADWHLWMIDFSRAFRQHTYLQNPKDLTRCDRVLLEKLRRLDAKEVAEKTGSCLTDAEVKGVMARRDKIVAVFEDLVARKGEKEILY